MDTQEKESIGQRKQKISFTPKSKRVNSKYFVRRPGNPQNKSLAHRRVFQRAVLFQNASPGTSSGILLEIMAAKHKDKGPPPTQAVTKWTQEELWLHMLTTNSLVIVKWHSGLYMDKLSGSNQLQGRPCSKSHSSLVKVLAKVSRTSSEGAAEVCSLQAAPALDWFPKGKARKETPYFSPRI